MYLVTQSGLGICKKGKNMVRNQGFNATIVNAWYIELSCIAKQGGQICIKTPRVSLFCNPVLRYKVLPVVLLASCWFLSMRVSVVA